MNKGDIIKTNAWIDSLDKILNGEFEKGVVYRIEPSGTFFNKIFQREEKIVGKIWIKFFDGRILPCYKEELIKI